MQAWQKLAANLDKRQPRERLLLAATTLFIVLALWDSFLLAPQRAHWQEKNAANTTTTSKLSANALLLEQLQQQVEQDPNTREQLRLQRVQAEIARIETHLHEKTVEFILPQQMVSVLKEMLQHQKGLKLMGMHALGAKALIVPAAAMETDKDMEVGEHSEIKVNVYRHRLQMRLKGDYLTVLAYLRELEALPWRFDWDLLDMRMQAYPQAEVLLQVSTLSMEEGWIGV